MKTIWRRLTHLSLALILTAGTAVTLSGCEKKSPSEKAAEKVGEAVEEAGEAVEEAGEAVSGQR